MPPEMVSSTGSPLSLPAKSRKGKTAWKTSSALAAGDSARMVMFLSNSSPGPRAGRNSSVLLPTSRPLTSAPVAFASQAIDVKCCDLSPVVGNGVSSGGLECGAREGAVVVTSASWSWAVAPHVRDLDRLACDRGESDCDPD